MIEIGSVVRASNPFFEFEIVRLFKTTAWLKNKSTDEVFKGIKHGDYY